MDILQTDIWPKSVVDADEDADADADAGGGGGNIGGYGVSYALKTAHNFY